MEFLKLCHSYLSLSLPNVFCMAYSLEKLIVALYILFLSVQTFGLVLSATYEPTCRQHTFSNKGRDFIVTFPKGFGSMVYKLYIATQETTHVRVLSPVTLLKSDHIISGQTVKTLDIPLQLTLNTEGRHRKFVHLSSNKDIAVFVMGASKFGVADAYIVYPTTSQSRAYILGSHTARADAPTHQIIVTGIYNNTQVIIISGPKGKVNVSVDAYESYVYHTQNDFTGASVISSKPVSVLSAADCVDVPAEVDGCDSVTNSPSPLEIWGTQFVVPSMPPRSGYMVKVLASKYTRIKFYNSTTNSSSYTSRNKPLVLYLGSDPLVIIAEGPVTVLQYGLSQLVDNTYGDPSLTTVPALSNFANEYVFPYMPCYLSFANCTNTLVIIIERSLKPGLTLDGNYISQAWSQPCKSPLSVYDVIYVNLTFGVHILSHDKKGVRYGALLYGRQYFRGFSLPLGVFHQADTCRNNGYCGNDNRCICRWGFSGRNCEIKALSKPDLAPQLHAKELDPLNSMAWYNALESSHNNKVCFVKVGLVNSSLDSVLTAISYDSSGTSFGNYSSGPINQFGNTSGIDRVACLEVKCPFFNGSGAPITTRVKIKVSSKAVVCTVNYINKNLQNVTVVNSPNQHDSLEFRLDPGNNYGLLYGVYISQGRRQLAKYLAEHKCFSGRNYNIGVINPQRATLANYLCS